MLNQTEWELSSRAVNVLERIASALDALANCTKDGVIQSEDVVRAKVYSEHLGAKLRDESGNTSTTPRG